MKSFRQRVKVIIPSRLTHWYRARQLARLRASNQSRSAQVVFSEIYSRRDWGDGEEFDSGSGSRRTVTEPYVAFVRQLIADTGYRTAVDVGCGDFRVASQFVDSLDLYVGVDVVPALNRCQRANSVIVPAQGRDGCLQGPGRRLAIRVAFPTRAQHDVRGLRCRKWK